MTISRDDVLKLLNGGVDGIAEWNQRREAGEVAVGGGARVRDPGCFRRRLLRWAGCGLDSSAQTTPRGGAVR